MSEKNEFFGKFNDSTKAKLGIYKAYITKYLKVLSKAYKQSWNTKNSVYIADLFAGPGRDELGNPGSPLILLDYLSQTYLDGLQVKICFNEMNPENCQKLNQIVSGHKAPKQSWVEVNVQNQDYSELLPKIIAKHKNHNYFKRFFFIDPFGYKGIHLDDIKAILNDGNTELLLFLPVSFIYRFKSKDEDYKAIRIFLDDFISVPDPSTIGSDVAFVRSILDTLREKLGLFVDSFIIQDNSRKGHNCLIYFSSNRKGLEKFVETKWNIDKEEGSGYNKNQGDQVSFLESFFYESLEEKLMTFLETGHKTNIEVRNFCYEHGSLPKHGNAALKKFSEQGKIQVRLCDKTKQPRKNAFYLDDDKNERIYIKAV